MNIFIIILLALAGIIALFFLVALIVPKRFTLERTIEINKSRQEVFNYLKLLRNQEKYSVWVMKDPNIRLVYTGTDGTAGFTSSWESSDKNVGIGEQEIKSISENERIEVEIRFKKPFEGTNHAVTTVSTTGSDQTRVKSTFSGQCKYPMNVMNLFMGKLVGNDMQKNLSNLKAILEK